MSLSLAILLTCHNRKNKTLNCLENLHLQAGIEEMVIKIYLVDDGSSDNTYEEVKMKFPSVILLKGDGSLFWNRGMHMAFSEAVKSSFDYYLWINDDTLIYPHAISKLLEIYNEVRIEKEIQSHIIVGCVKDPKSKKLSYGGYDVLKKPGVLSFSMVEPNGKIRECSTMCGNLVLIPAAVVEKIGIIDSYYKHRWGDVDFGLTAKKTNCRIFISPDFLGDCENNLQSDLWKDKKLPLRQRYKLLHSIKGLEKNDWIYFNKKHLGALWFINWAKPYIKILFTTILERLSIVLR